MGKLNKLFTEDNLLQERLVDFTYEICMFYDIKSEQLSIISDVVDNIYE